MSNKKILILFISLSVIYLLEALFISSDASARSKFNLSATEVKLLSLTVTLPIIFIWMLGCYAYIKFRSYVDTIAKDKDGRVFRIISYGLLALFLWLPISSVFSNMATYLYRTNPSWTAPLVITNNYINLALVLVGFALIYKGAYKLINLKESRNISGWKYITLLPLVFISALFTFLTLNNPVRQFPSADVPTAAYYLPDWLLIITIIIPYVLVFYLGFFSILYIYMYRKNVRGIIYKNALDYFAKGLLCIVLSIIVIRYLAALTTLFDNSTLKIILLIIYLLILLLLCGFILLVKSVKKLKAIEKA